MNCAIGTVLIANTDVATTTHTISGLPFQPTFAIFWYSGGTGTVDTVAALTHRRGMGVAAGTSARWALAGLSVTGGGTADTAQAQSDNGCILTVSNANAIDGRVDFNGFTSDGFVLIVDDQLPATLRVRWMALDPTNADVFTIAEPGATGDVDVTSLAFQPELALFGGVPGVTAAEAGAADSRIFIGAATGSGAQAVWAGGSNDGANNMVAASYCTDADCIAAIDTNLTGINPRASFVSFLSNGLRVNFSERSGTRVFHGAALAGNGQYAVGSGTTQTDTTTPISMPGGGSVDTITGGLVISHCKAESASDTLDSNDEWSMGAFTSASDRLAIGVMDDDGAANAEVAIGAEFDAVYMNISTGDALEGAMDVNDMSAKTYVMDDADPSAAFFFNILFGTAAAGGKPTTYYARQRG